MLAYFLICREYVRYIIKKKFPYLNDLIKMLEAKSDEGQIIFWLNWKNFNEYQKMIRLYFVLPIETFPKVTSPLGSSVFDVQVRVLLPAP